MKVSLSILILKCKKDSCFIVVSDSKQLPNGNYTEFKIETFVLNLNKKDI